MNPEICPHCGKPIHQPRPDGRCPACGKPEPPAPSLNLPDDLRDFLASGRQLEYDPAQCENFGRVKLRQLTKLRVIKYPTRPTEDGRVPWLDDDPHKGEDGYYYVPLVDLVSECEQRPSCSRCVFSFGCPKSAYSATGNLITQRFGPGRGCAGQTSSRIRSIFLTLNTPATNSNRGRSITPSDSAGLSYSRQRGKEK